MGVWVACLGTIMAAMLWSTVMKSMREWRDFISNPWEAIFPTTMVGPIGMDDQTRKAFCKSVDQDLQRSPSLIRVECGGDHVDTAVLIMNNSDPLITGEVRIDLIATAWRQPYSELLARFKMLRVDRVAEPVSQVAGRAEKLGVKTVADFWAACGFHRFRVRDEKSGSGSV